MTWRGKLLRRVVEYFLPNVAKKSTAFIREMTQKPVKEFQFFAISGTDKPTTLRHNPEDLYPAQYGGWKLIFLIHCVFDIK
jgi:hypothetical protein